MRCPDCDRENEKASHYCRHCRASLWVKCPSCGGENPRDSLFCGACGERLEEVEEQLSNEENRYLTILFCDRVKSTEDAEEAGETELKIASAFRRVCDEVGSAHSADKPEIHDDEAVFYFGYPAAREDDAQRAVRCGLELVRRVAALEIPTLPLKRLAVRVGIHSGHVTMGKAHPLDRRPFAHGLVKNVAARLQARAEPGTVVVSKATWELVQGSFKGHALGGWKLKGVSRVMRVWRIEKEALPHERLDTARALSRLEGRAAERALLEEAWEAALKGNTRFLLLRGDAGVGKSRLALEARDWAEKHHRARVLLARATAYNQSQPFAPLVPLLTHAFHLEPGSREPEFRFRESLRILRLDDRPDGVDAPFLAPLVGVAVRQITGLSPAQTRARTLETLKRTFEALARRAPTLLVFEDLHWADESTSELLEHLVATLGGLPLLALISMRPAPQLASWGRGTNLRVLDLEPLSGADGLAIIRNVARSRPLPPPIEKEILARSQGVPLFLEELTRLELETGALREEGDSFGYDAALDIEMIPPRVAQSLGARILGLPPNAKETAKAAATIGREFDLSMLHLLRRRTDDELRSDVQALMDAGLAWPSRESGSETFVFKHALIRDAAYKLLYIDDRLRCHEIIAGALAQGEAGPARHDLVAYHLERAGRHADALTHWEAAARDATQRSAMQVAASNWGRAVRSLRRLREAQERDEHELELQLKISQALMAASLWASDVLEKACTRAKELATQLGNAESLYQAVWGLWSVYFLRGRLKEALPAAEQVRQMAEASGDLLLQVTARHATAYTLLFRGQLEEALSEADAGLALFDFDQEVRLSNIFQLSSSVCLHQARAQALWMLGRVQEADIEAGRMLRLGRRLKGPSLVAACAFALHGGGLRHSYARRMGRLRALADRLRDLAREEGSDMWYAVGETYRGIIAHALAEPEARQRMMAGLKLFTGTQTRVTLVMMHVMIAAALSDSGHDADALRLLDIAEREMEQRGEEFDAPEISRVRGKILARRGEIEQAESAFTESLEFARRQHARSLELRAALALYELLARNGRAAEGRERLVKALEYGSWPPEALEAREARAILQKPPATLSR